MGNVGRKWVNLFLTVSQVGMRWEFQALFSQFFNTKKGLNNRPVKFSNFSGQLFYGTPWPTKCTAVYVTFGYIWTESCLNCCLNLRARVPAIFQYQITFRTRLKIF